MRQSWTDDRLDDLSRHMDERFDRVDERFKRIDERFEGVDKRLDKVDSEIKELRKEMYGGFQSLQRMLLLGMFGMLGTVLAALVTALAA